MTKQDYILVESISAITHAQSQVHVPNAIGKLCQVKKDLNKGAILCGRPQLGTKLFEKKDYDNRLHPMCEACMSKLKTLNLKPNPMPLSCILTARDRTWQMVNGRKM